MNKNGSKNRDHLAPRQNATGISGGIQDSTKQGIAGHRITGRQSSEAVTGLGDKGSSQ
jgi:hypothetical protein